MSTGLLSYADLEQLWQACGETPEARNRWVRRRCVRLGLRPVPAFGRGKHARFRPSDVDRLEERSATVVTKARRRRAS